MVGGFFAVMTVWFSRPVTAEEASEKFIVANLKRGPDQTTDNFDIAVKFTPSVTLLLARLTQKSTTGDQTLISREKPAPMILSG